MRLSIVSAILSSRADIMLHDGLAIGVGGTAGHRHLAFKGSRRASICPSEAANVFGNASMNLSLRGNEATRGVRGKWKVISATHSYQRRRSQGPKGTLAFPRER